MAIKALKTYDVKFPDLKEACQKLNESGLITNKIKIIGASGPDVMQGLLTAIDTVPEAKLKDLPEEVSVFYDALPQEIFDDAASPAVKADAEVEGEGEEAAETQEAAEDDGVTSDCPVFKEGYDPKEPICVTCEADTPEEYAACKKACEAVAAKTKKKSAAKPAGKRSRYGHMPGSMAARIDDLVFKGATMDEMTKLIGKEFKRDDKRAAAKIKAHIAVLISTIGVEITDTDGKFKAKGAYAKTQTKDNTVSTL